MKLILIWLLLCLIDFTMILRYSRAPSIMRFDDCSRALFGRDSILNSTLIGTSSQRLDFYKSLDGHSLGKRAYIMLLQKKNVFVVVLYVQQTFDPTVLYRLFLFLCALCPLQVVGGRMGMNER